MKVIELMRELSEMNPTSEVCFAENANSGELSERLFLDLFEDSESGDCVFVVCEQEK